MGCLFVWWCWGVVVMVVGKVRTREGGRTTGQEELGEWVAPLIASVVDGAGAGAADRVRKGEGGEGGGSKEERGGRRSYSQPPPAAAAPPPVALRLQGLVASPRTLLPRVVVVVVMATAS